MKTHDNASGRNRVTLKGDVSIAVSIIEDDGPAREILSDWIRRAQGFRCVSQHRTAESALAKLQVEKPAVVLMDINLPGISGIEAMQALRADAATAHIPIIALSANAVPRDIERALKAGFSGYLTKPINVARFMTVLDEALESQRAASGCV